MQLKILSWNLGGGSMGEEADFAYEGGAHYIPSSAEAVRKNIQGIRAILKTVRADALLLQEVTTGSILNRWHNLLERIKPLFRGYKTKKAVQFSLPFLPQMMSCEHSLLSVLKREFLHRTLVHRLTAKEVYAKFITRADAVIASRLRLPSGKRLSLLNVHLAAFDHDGLVRRKQFQEVLALGKRLHAQGPVIIGGDWNMYVGHARSIQQTALTPFPYELLPLGWKSAHDTRIPTARSCDKPLWGGVSTSTIDGFVVSPEVDVLDVRTKDEGFRFSDHNPVELTAEIKT